MVFIKVTFIELGVYCLISSILIWRETTPPLHDSI